MSTKNPLLIALAFLIFSTSSAHATLINNGNTTIDTATGLEWLDLTLTTGQSFNNIIIDGFGGYAAQGYVHATLDQLCDLWSTVGVGSANCLSSTQSVTEAISQASADLLTGLFGDTWTSSGEIASAGIYDGGLIGTGWVGLGCVHASSDYLCINNTPPPPSTTRILQWTTLDGANSVVGSWLVRSAQSIPEPTILALLVLGLAGFGVKRQQIR